MGFLLCPELPLPLQLFCGSVYSIQLVIILYLYQTSNSILTLVVDPGEITDAKEFYDFFFFLIQFNVPFKIISLIETSQSIDRWGQTGVPRENHLTQPQAELGLSHMWPVRGSNLHQTQR